MFSDIMPFPTCADAQGRALCSHPARAPQLSAPFKYELQPHLRRAAQNHFATPLRRRTQQFNFSSDCSGFCGHPR